MGNSPKSVSSFGEIAYPITVYPLYLLPPWHRIALHLKDERTFSGQRRMDRGIGFCGAHRVGKTTLAQAVTLATNLPFLQTRTSQVFEHHGLDPAQPLAFETRLSIQEAILSTATKVWSQADGPFISDRTPLDMAAYTLAEVQSTTVLDSDRLAEYLDACIQRTNQIFSTLIIVPPGIPLIPAPGKAALHQAYIEHIHTLVVGLCYESRLSATIQVHQLTRDILSLDERIQQTLSFLGQAPLD